MPMNGNTKSIKHRPGSTESTPGRQSRKTDVCQRARAVRRDSGAGPVEGVPRELWVRVALAVNWSPVQVHGGKAFIHDSNLVTSHPHGGPWREALEEMTTVSSKSVL